MDNLEEKAKNKPIVTNTGNPYKDGNIFDKLNLENIKVNTKKYRYEEHLKRKKTIKQETNFFKIRIGMDKELQSYIISICFKPSDIELATTKTPSLQKALKYYEGSILYLKEREY